MADEQKADLPARKHRDPAHRRQVIVEAAAELLLQEGIRGFTHRKVAVRAGVPLGSTTQYFANIDELREAGMRCVAEGADRALRETATILKRDGATPEAVARFLHQYTSDASLMRTDALFYAAAAYDDQLRVLVTQWNEGLVGMFKEFMDEEAAQAVALFMDGVCGQACYSQKPVDLSFLTRTIAAIMNCGNVSDEHGGRTAV
ncbi:MAG: TetR family transcriptional regulator [Gordonibacter sp.]|uniref:TetR/AcrR family transcriptional regulator n=1 Tax=Gordonibacter sp. TaxID=1968902 RepID=UPI002FCC8FF9